MACFSKTIANLSIKLKNFNCIKSEKRSIVEVAQNLRDLPLQRENVEIRAIYGAGNYLLSTEYSNFKVDSAQ